MTCLRRTILLHCDSSRNHRVSTMAKTSSERKKEQRLRDKELGIKQLTIRVHEEDEEAIKAHAKALLDARLKNKLK